MAQGKEPSLQQYRFSPYIESRLLSACVLFGDGFGGYRDRAREYNLFGGLIVRIMKSTSLPNRVSVYPRWSEAYRNGIDVIVFEVEILECCLRVYS